MLDIRCVYENTITLRTPDHKLIIIGAEIGRAQQSANMQDIIICYDKGITEYGEVSIQTKEDHLTITYNDKIVVYDQGIGDASNLPEKYNGIFINIKKGYEHFIPLLQKSKPSLIVIMPSSDQLSAIECASIMMREGLSVPKYLKEGQYITIQEI